MRIGSGAADRGAQAISAPRGAALQESLDYNILFADTVTPGTPRRDVIQRDICVAHLFWAPLELCLSYLGGRHRAAAGTDDNTVSRTGLDAELSRRYVGPLRALSRYEACGPEPSRSRFRLRKCVPADKATPLFEGVGTVPGTYGRSAIRGISMRPRVVGAGPLIATDLGPLW